MTHGTTDQLRVCHCHIEPHWGVLALLQMLPGDGHKSFEAALDVDPQIISINY